jgi:hypothetical protein
MNSSFEDKILKGGENVNPQSNIDKSRLNMVAIN